MGPFHTYRTIKSDSAPTANHLVMGPWTHGVWAWTHGRRVGNVDFGQPTADYYREQIEMPFFVKYLKGRTVPRGARSLDLRGRHEPLAGVRHLATGERPTSHLVPGCRRITG